MYLHVAIQLYPLWYVVVICLTFIGSWEGAVWFAQNLSPCYLFLFSFTREDNDVIYKHYAIGISGNEFQVEGFVSLCERCIVCTRRYYSVCREFPTQVAWWSPI